MVAPVVCEHAWNLSHSPDMSGVSLYTVLVSQIAAAHAASTTNILLRASRSLSLSPPLDSTRTFLYLPCFSFPCMSARKIVHHQVVSAQICLCTAENPTT